MGVGLEKTDLTLAKARGIVVTTTPVLYDDVSDLAVILGMTACRRIAAADRFVRSGQWLQGRMRAGPEILGQARRHPRPRPDRHGSLRAPAGLRHDHRLLRPAAEGGRALPGVRLGAALAQNSDILFLCAAGGPTGGHIVTAEVLDALGPKGVFVNVARGWLVDEKALVEALTRAGSAPPGWMCSRTSRRCRRRCSSSTTWS